MEERFVVVERKNGDEFINVLPVDTTLENAKEIAARDWSYLTDGEKKTHTIHLAKIAVAEKELYGRIELLPVYDSDEEYEQALKLGYQTMCGYNPIEFGDNK